MGRLKKIAESTDNRKIGFSAPDSIHGAVKMIVGWCEMNEYQYKGKPLTERDFLSSLIAGIYQSGQENWLKTIEQNLRALETLVDSKSVKK